ncbi:unnamed protein product [Schistosoma rodhaini]|uniref:G_PROTEIN_RECEP_F1_2 domain-containing protein n=1 Tax=Schistosoma rodhaini TaxID=6188 RepID=A0A183RDA0_9TREM|nr:unnamed protein product [Schistosoma rodhaini]
MNISNSTIQLFEFNESIDPIWLSTLILLGSVSLLGTIGNLLVLGVYIQQHFWPHLHLKYRHIYYKQKLSLLNTNELCNTSYLNEDNGNHNSHIIQIHESNEQLFTKTTGTPTFFILVLACVDLMVCCFVVPLTFYMEYIHLQPSTDIWCKAHAFLNICNIMFSSLLIIAIALERYLTICHPLRRILTMKRAKYLTLSLAIFCIVYGILGALHHSLGVTKDEPDIQQCCDTPEISNVTYIQILTYDILQKGNTASFILSILSVIILYSLILRVVIKTHRAQRYSPMVSNNIPYKTVIMNHSNINQKSIMSSNDLNNNNQDTTYNTTYNNNNIEHSTNPPPPSTPSQHHRDHRKSITNRIKMNISIKNITESTLWREIRSASVLFVIAVVYIIVFTPALLTANKLIKFNLLAYNTYYLNNMSNPLIYCFMSNAFRKKLKILFFNSIRSCKCYHNNNKNTKVLHPHHLHHRHHLQHPHRHQRYQRRKQQHLRARELINNISNNNDNNNNNDIISKTNSPESE